MIIEKRIMFYSEKYKYFVFWHCYQFNPYSKFLHEDKKTVYYRSHLEAVLTMREELGIDA